MEKNINQRIICQTTMWLILLFGIPTVVSGGEMTPFKAPHALGIFTGVILMILLNLKLLFPRFYEPSNLKKYVFSIIISVFAIRLFVILLLEPSMKVLIEMPQMSINRVPFENLNSVQLIFVQMLIGSIPLFIVTLASTLYETSIAANRNLKETAMLKAEKLETELKFLKSQINPHFLFNSLNNIYTLTLLDADLAGKNLLKLSEMLRYLLYECDAEKVALGRELTYLENYIDLFSLKDDEQLNIQFDKSAVNPSVMIAPLLFIPFVENAFKHSQVEDLDKGWIAISISGDEEKVHFDIKNSIPQMNISKDEAGGIGLQNVKRQLDLIYPNQHHLNIEKSNDTFSVTLTLELRD